jgi:hypothetical protein
LSKPGNYNEFIDSLLKQHLYYMNELRNRHVQIHFAHHRYMIYFWMHDNNDTSFSLDYQGDVKDDIEREITFRSRDSKLTAALADIFALEWRKGSDQTC